MEKMFCSDIDELVYYWLYFFRNVIFKFDINYHMTAN